MSLPKRYNPRTTEPDLQQCWEQAGFYQYDPSSSGPRFTIDSPPATVSGNLHLGHVYSYSHTDFIARFRRMSGENVYYPMGFDDNGLATERLVEKKEGVRPQEIGREAFIHRCMKVAETVEDEYRALWQRLGLSIDWRYSYRTIDPGARRLAQWSFIDLYAKGLAYRQEAPAIWCPECQTAIAQAEVHDLERESTFCTLDFRLADGRSLPIASTRPEFLPACVAIFTHPDDPRYAPYLGQLVTIPLFGRTVPLLADHTVDLQKGSGVVMCCTFGDTADIEWWRRYNLPLIAIMGRDGRLAAAAGPFAGMFVADARAAIITALEKDGSLLGLQPTRQMVRVHERCDTPLETINCPQWFIRVLDYKTELLKAGERIAWHPAHMGIRYRQWVENLAWDWGISRQRYYGVPLPVWYCASCGEPLLAESAALPVNPLADRPSAPCAACGSATFIPDNDVFDTWFTSSLTPQIAGRFQEDNTLYEQVSPFSMRSQAHEIIRSWAFYTIVKSWHHFQEMPFKHAAISGWGLAPDGTEKLSKSRGGGTTPPQEMIARYSADAVRYWAASTAIGKDAIISEEKIQAGQKLVTKLWNVARFSQRFLQGPSPTLESAALTLADRWLLAHTARLIRRATDHFRAFDYAAAKRDSEGWFWRVLADNYLEMAKLRLYASDAGARYALGQALLAALKLFAPIIPHVTERIFLELFAEVEGCTTLHQASWPVAETGWEDAVALTAGEALVEIATAVRGYKSDLNLPLGTELGALQLGITDPTLEGALPAGEIDLRSITRAAKVDIKNRLTGPPTTMTTGGIEILISLH